MVVKRNGRRYAVAKLLTHICLGRGDFSCGDDQLHPSPSLKGFASYALCPGKMAFASYALYQGKMTFASYALYPGKMAFASYALYPGKMAFASYALYPGKINMLCRVWCHLFAVNPQTDGPAISFCRVSCAQ
eukprot:scaffold212411_cov23-Tisochrysis_lutea.AAC.1